MDEAEDDEETIEQEEKLALTYGQAVSTETEVAQLTADADCPLDDLLPPGYLEYLQTNVTFNNDVKVNLLELSII